MRWLLRKLWWLPGSTTLLNLLHQLDWPWEPGRHSSGPTERVILDRPPDRYWLTWSADEGGRPYHPFVMWEHRFPGNFRRWRPIGHLYLAWGEDHPDLLELCDIVLWQAHRRQGIGTPLLQTVIALAEEAGMQGIFGQMTAVDEMEPTRLASWYQRNGFTLGGPQGNRLRLRLPQMHPH